MAEGYVEYAFHAQQSKLPIHSSYVFGPVIAFLDDLPKGARVLDVGCGNGQLVQRLADRGFEAMGIDLSSSGLAQARENFPHLRFVEAGADARVLETLAETPFDAVTSTEVVEHLYDPKSYARGLYAALKPGGRVVLTTPYHGYLKNLAIALTGKFDRHVDPLWDCGHVKFWSRRTLGKLLTDVGFRDVRFAGAGRVPYLWMSMVLCATK